MLISAHFEVFTTVHLEGQFQNKKVLHSFQIIFK